MQVILLFGTMLCRMVVRPIRLIRLGNHWYQEYIAKTSEAYKTFIGLRAIENYLRFDELAKIRINKLYEHLCYKDSNISSLREQEIKKQAG